MAKNNFLMNDKWDDVFSTLPDDKAGQLIKAAFSYHKTGEFQIDDPVLNAVFNMIKSEIDENDRRYEEICERNRQNVSRRYTKKNEKLQEATTVDDRIPLATDNDIDNDLKEKGILTDTQKESPAKAELLMPAAREIINYLNEKTGSRYSASSKHTIKLIKSLMKEGHSVDDFKTVIDNKVDEWAGDPKMEDYLRPNTLFAQSHFDDYLNQKGSRKVLKKPPEPVARKKDKFFNFPQRDDAESKELVQQLIRQQTAGGA